MTVETSVTTDAYERAASVRRGPLDDLDGWAAALEQLPAGIQVRELRFRTQLSLRLDPHGPSAAPVAEVLGVELPLTPCTFAVGEQMEVLWLGPDEWLVVAPPESAARLGESLRTASGDGFKSVTDVSAQRTTLSVSGPLTREVLARGCSIDLHPLVNPAGTCVQTLLAQAGVILQIRDSTATDVRLLVRASFAPYVASWLVDACTEYRARAAS